MLSSPSTGRRIAGKALIALTAAAALPLTASHATEYVDVPARPSTPAGLAQASAPATAAVVSTTSAVAGTAASSGPVSMQQNADGTVMLSGNVRVGPDSTAFFDDDTVLINGKRKTLDQLTAAERSKLRAVILDSQQDLVRERAELPRELAEAKREADRARSGELRREHLRDIEEMRRDLAEVDSEAEDPAKRKAEILRDLHEAEAEDIAREEREAIMEDNPAKRVADLRSEEQQMTRMLARLNQLDRR